MADTETLAPDTPAADMPAPDTFAQDAPRKVSDSGSGPEVEASPPMFNRRDPGVSAGYRRSIYALPVKVDVVLGTVTPTVKDVLAFEEGTVLTLEERMDAPVTLSVNGHIIAMGELVETGTDDVRLGVKITRIFDVPDDLGR